jgi:hypothetical protein
MFGNNVSVIIHGPNRDEVKGKFLIEPNRELRNLHET